VVALSILRLISMDTVKAWIVPTLETFGKHGAAFTRAWQTRPGRVWCSLEIVGNCFVACVASLRFVCDVYGSSG
jgi:hypothetical protein